MNIFTRFFCWCAGTETSILSQDECVTDRGKHASVGATVLFTGILASFSAGYALDTILKDFRYSILFGLVWGSMIFNLDRFIVRSMRGQNFLMKLLSALPRAAMAILISIVISKPLELRLFEKEIEAKIQEENLQTVAALEISQNQRFSEIDDLKMENSKLQNEIHEKEKARDLLSAEMIGEAEGTRGTGVKGEGSMYKLKEAAHQKLAEELDLLRNANNLKIEENEKRIRSLQELKDQDMNGARLARNQADTLLARLSALEHLEKTDPSVRKSHLFVWLLFCFIEICPIFTKLFLKDGPYERILYRKERMVYLQEHFGKTTDKAIASEKAKQQQDNTLKLLTLENQIFHESVSKLQQAPEFIDLQKEFTQEIFAHLKRNFKATASIFSFPTFIGTQLNGSILNEKAKANGKIGRINATIEQLKNFVNLHNKQ